MYTSIKVALHVTLFVPDKYSSVGEKRVELDLIRILLHAFVCRRRTSIFLSFSSPLLFLTVIQNGTFLFS